MRTIKTITDKMVNWLRAERQSPMVSTEAQRAQTPGLGLYFLLPARIRSRITIDYETGCWRTFGWNSGNGFANIGVCGVTLKVHRVTYTLLRGPIPLGLVLDHDKKTGCKYRDCSNPWHCEPVTVKENTDRGDAPKFKKREVINSVQS